MKKAFSLIEIGIVLIVVGILISAVMKGQDIIQSAEVKEMNQNFLSKWVSVTSSYYDKLGYNLSASSTKRMMIAADGLSDADTNETIGCESLITYAKQAGINVQKVISTNTESPCRRAIRGEFTDEVSIGVGLESFRINTDEESNATRNFVLFFNMPGDIALAYDRLVDQQADLTAGRVIALDVYSDGNARSAGDMLDDNLSSGVAENGDANGLEPVQSIIDATKLYTIGVILDH